jgi:glycosyltransferase involved in cell wall biosynthesis
MNVTIASSGLGHVSRGVEAWAADLGRALAQRGENVILYKGGGTAEAPYERVISCWQRNAPKTRRLLRWMPRGAWRVGLGSALGLEQTSFALPLLLELRRQRADILHVQEPQLALLVQRAQQLGFVRTLAILGHGTNEPLDFLQKVTYLHHLTPWYLEEARAAGVWKPTWTAIPNFVDTNRYCPGRDDALRDELAIPRGALVVLSVAAIKRDHKRVDYLLHEFERLRREAPELPVWFVVAGGREPETDEVIAEGRRLLGDRVRFLVNFPRELTPRLYRMSDVFALGSLREMLGIVLLEASASALPSFVHRHPVLEWVTGPGGECLDMTAPGKLAAALRDLLEEPGRPRHMGEQARQHCLAHFSQDRVVDQILDYYRFVVRHQRSRHPRLAATPRLSAAVSH